MTKTTNEYLQPVLDWLKAGAPHEGTGISFDMSMFQNQRGCGTACCIAGAVQQFNELQVTPFEGDHRPPCYEIGEQIGLTTEQVEDLFFLDNEEIPLWRVTPEWAARTLEHFMETGEVEWDIS